ncbi:VG15 protein [Corynebacterium glyciniphilum]|uniref:VG15 protein n=1 Tax=Corynebacterium glyciniphilum TaxID=1404244 RepID=UPI003FD18D87
MTPDQMSQVHTALDHVAVLSQQQLAVVHDQVSTVPRDRWADEMSYQAPGILLGYRSVGVDIMAGGLDAATTLGVSVAAMEASTLLTDRRVESLVRWVAENAPTPMAAMMKIGGIGQKLVLEGPRSYTYTLSEEHGTTARRYAQPGACEWCRYIAVQEHRYEHYGSEWVQTNDADRFHEHCRCVLIPASEYIEPDYITDWDRQVEAVRDEVGGYGKNTWRDHLSAMRRKTNE